MIFSMMVIAMGILYAQIGPLVISFEAESESTNQEFVFLEVARSVEVLAASSPNSRNHVHIISSSTTYDVNSSANSLGLTFDAGGGPQQFTVPLGEFSAQIDKRFQTTAASGYISSLHFENTYINTEQTQNTGTSVIYRQIFTGLAEITMYNRAYGNLQQDGLLSYTYNVIVYQLTTDPNQPISDFPVSQDEWTLTLRKGPATVTNPFSIAIGASPMTVSQALDGNATGLDVYSYSLPSGSTVSVNQVIIPIYFSL